MHGFDEFYGNLYHLNAEEDPEDSDYPDPKEFPQFKAKFGPCGVLHCWATDRDDPTEQPRWGRVGKQKIEDTGPLNRKRMESCDDEFVAAAKDWIKRQHAAGKPFSAGSIRLTCTSELTRSRPVWAKRGAGSRPTTTPWSTMIRTLASC